MAKAPRHVFYRARFWGEDKQATFSSNHPNSQVGNITIRILRNQKQCPFFGTFARAHMSQRIAVAQHPLDQYLNSPTRLLLRKEPRG